MMDLVESPISKRHGWRAPVSIVKMLIAWLIFLGFADFAQAAAPEVKAISPGLGGKFKVGNWTPVRITLEADEACQGRLHVTVPDSDGIAVAYNDLQPDEISLVAGESRTVTLYIRVGRVDAQLECFWTTEGQTHSLARQMIEKGALLTSQQWVVTLGPEIGVEGIQRARRTEEVERVIATRIGSADELPEKWLGWEGVDCLVIPLTDDASKNDSLLKAITKSQWQAIDRWLELGGRLLLCGGSQGPALYQPGGLLQRYAPGKQPTIAKLDHASTLETYTLTAKPVELGTASGPFGGVIEVVAFEKTNGIVELADEAGKQKVAWVTRHPFGLGQIVAFNADLHRAQLSAWPERSKLLATLLQAAAGDDRKNSNTVRQLTHSGYQDLAGQVRAALDRYPNSRLIPFGLVLTILVIYVLLIGPVDYFVLRRFFPHMAWSWLTFSLIVLGLCALGIGAGVMLKGGDALNQAEIVDIDVETQTVRGTTWIHLYRQSPGSLDLNLEPQVGETAEVQLSWQGLPGEGLGGMHSRISTGGASESYRQVLSPTPTLPSSFNAHIKQLSMRQWASKNFFARWAGSMKLEPTGELLGDDSGRLEGTFINPLGIELTECRLVCGRWLYPLGKVAPGEKIVISQRLQPTDVRWRLTRRKVDDLKDFTAAWDEFNTDVDRLLEVMMLHETAGGKNYTGLWNRYLPYTDASGSLRTGRAVLIGKATGKASELRIGGQPVSDTIQQNWTYYRLILPVKPRSAPVDNN